MAEAVACNNRLRKLMIKDRGKDCCVMIWAITWATILARVWGSIIRYIGRGGADWSEDEVALEL